MNKNINSHADLIPHDPVAKILDKDFIGRAILECLSNNDPEGVMEVIQTYLDTLEKTQLGELEAYDAYLDAARCTASQLETAEERGEIRGEARGLKMGAIEEKTKIAQKMFDRFDIDEIAEITGLSIADIENLKKRK